MEARKPDKIDFTGSNKDRSLTIELAFGQLIVISYQPQRFKGTTGIQELNHRKLNNSLLEDIQFKDEVKKL